SLRTNAMAAAASLTAPTRTPTTPPATATTAGPGSGTGAISNVPNTGVRPVVSSSPKAPFITTTASPVAAVHTTPPMSIGAIRWALFVVLIVGLGGTVGGPLLRFALGRRPPP